MISNEALAEISHEKLAIYKKIQNEETRRQVEERIRNFVPCKPDDVNQHFPDLGCNDQWGFIHSTAKERWVFGGNRSGKTEVGVADAIMLCDGTHPVLSEKYPPPVFLRYISTSWEDGMAKIIIPKFMEMAIRSHLRGGSFNQAFHMGHKTLSWTNKSFVEFMTSEQNVNKHGGVKRHGIYLDEHHAKPYYDENSMRIVDYGGFIVGTMTPEEGITWEADHVQTPPEGITLEWWAFWTEKNPHLSPEGVNDVRNKLKVNPKLAAVKLRGEFIPLTGMVYPMFDASKLLVPDFDIPRHWERHILIDPHLRKFTALMWVAWDPDGYPFIYRTRKVKLPVAELAPYIRAQSSGEKYNLWIGDEAMGGKGLNIFGEESVLEQLNMLGLPFVGTNQASDKAFEAGVNKVQEYITPEGISAKCKLHIFESCNTPVEYIDGKLTGSIFWEFGRYRFKKEQKSDEETYREKVANVDDDLITLARYGLMAGPCGSGGAVRGDVRTDVDPFTQW